MSKRRKTGSAGSAGERRECPLCGEHDMPDGEVFCSKFCQEMSTVLPALGDGEGGCHTIVDEPAPESRSGDWGISDRKASNPKDIVGADKLPLHLWPETATAMGCLGMLDGALKYGRGNFRAVGVKASIYVDAAKRHLNAWFEGEACARDSGVPHLAHALACIAIMVDAAAAGKLNDDRAYPGGYTELVEELTPHVKRLKAAHADKSPKHYTRTDCDTVRP